MATVPRLFDSARLRFKHTRFFFLLLVIRMNILGIWERHAKCIRTFTVFDKKTQMDLNGIENEMLEWRSEKLNERKKQQSKSVSWYRSQPIRIKMTSDNNANAQWRNVNNRQKYSFGVNLKSTYRKLIWNKNYTFQYKIMELGFVFSFFGLQQTSSTENYGETRCYSKHMILHATKIQIILLNIE